MRFVHGARRSRKPQVSQRAIFFADALTLLVAQPPEAAAGAAAAAALPRLRLRLVAGGGTMAPDEMFDVAEGGVMAAAMSGEAQGFRGMSFFSFPSGDGVWRQQLFGVTNDVKNIAHVVRTKPGGMPSKSDTRVVAGDTLAVYGKAKMGVSPPHLASFLVELPAHDAADAALGDAAVLPRPLAAAATTPAKVPFGADKPVVSGGSDERHDRRRCSSLLKAAVAGNNAQTLDQSAHDAALDGAMPNVACVSGDLPPPVRAVLARTRARRFWNTVDEHCAVLRLQRRLGMEFDDLPRAHKFPSDQDASYDEDSDASDDECGLRFNGPGRARYLVPYTAEATGSVLRLLVHRYREYVEPKPADAPGLAELGVMDDILASGLALAPALALQALETVLRSITDGVRSGCVACCALLLPARCVTRFLPSLLQAVPATWCAQNAPRRQHLWR